MHCNGLPPHRTQLHPHHAVSATSEQRGTAKWCHWRPWPPGRPVQRGHYPDGLEHEDGLCMAVPSRQDKADARAWQQADTQADREVGVDTQQTVNTDTDTYVAATTATTMAARMPTTATTMTAASTMHSAKHGAASAGERPPLPPYPPLPPLVSWRRSHRDERQPKQPSLAVPSRLKHVNVLASSACLGRAVSQTDSCTVG